MAVFNCWMKSFCIFRSWTSPNVAFLPLNSSLRPLLRQVDWNCGLTWALKNIPFLCHEKLGLLLLPPAVKSLINTSDPISLADIHAHAIIMPRAMLAVVFFLTIEIISTSIIAMCKWGGLEAASSASVKNFNVLSLRCLNIRNRRLCRLSCIYKAKDFH